MPQDKPSVPAQPVPHHHVKHPAVPALPGESVAGEEDPGDFENASLPHDPGRDEHAPSRGPERKR